MLCKISNERDTFTVDNFQDLQEAKNCFPNYTVEPCNDIIDYKSFTQWVKNLMIDFRNKYIFCNEKAFIEELKDKNSAIEVEIERPDYSVGLIPNISLFLPNNIVLYYDYYIEDDGCFNVGDYFDEDTY